MKHDEKVPVKLSSAAEQGLEIFGDVLGHSLHISYRFLSLALKTFLEAPSQTQDPLISHRQAVISDPTVWEDVHSVYAKSPRPFVSFFSRIFLLLRYLVNFHKPSVNLVRYSQSQASLVSLIQVIKDKKA